MRHVLGKILVAAVAVAVAVPPAVILADESGRQWLRQVDDPEKLGLQLLEEGDLIGAKELLERAELAKPGDPKITRALAQVYLLLGNDALERGDPVEAEYYYERATQKRPTEGAAWAGLGRARFALDNEDGAIAALLQGEKLGHPDATSLLVRVYVRRADRLVDLDDLGGAERDLREALRRAADDAQALLVLGRLRLAQKRWREALEPLQRAAGDERYHDAAMLMLAIAYNGLERWSEAIETAATVTDVPAYAAEARRIQAQAHYSWASNAYRDGRYTLAAEHFAAAAALAPDWDDPLFGLGLSKLRQGDGFGAKRVLERLYARTPDYPQVRTVLAQAEHLAAKHLVELGQLAEAVGLLRHAHELDPKQAEILLTLAGVLERQGRYAPALDAYLQALAGGADPAAAHRGAARVLHDHLQRPLEALEHAEALLRLRPGDPEAERWIVAITRKEGLAAAQRGDTEAAIRLLGRYRDFRTDDPPVERAYARALLEALRFAEAVTVAERLYAERPNHPEHQELLFAAHVGLGDEATLAEDWPRAHRHYARALEVRPAAEKVRLRDGVALLHLGRYEEAVAALRHVWDRAPKLRARAAEPLVQALVGWADALLASDPGRAERLATEATGKLPEFADAYFIRAQARDRLGRYDEAIADGERYLQIAGQDDEEGRYLLAGLLRKGAAVAAEQRRYEPELRYARRLLALAPEDPEGLYRQGEALFHLDRWQEARPVLEAAVAAPGSSWRPQAYLLLARGHRRAGEVERAAKYYMAAHRLAPKLVPAKEQIATYMAAAEHAETDHRLEDAASYLAAAIELAPDDPAVNFAYGRILLALRRPGDAIPYLRKAHRALPDRREVALTYGDALLAAGDPLAAIEVWTPWEAPTRPDHEQVRVRIGRAYARAVSTARQLGRLDEAALYAERAARRLEDDPEPWYVLGEVQYDRGDLGEAIKAFYKVFTLDPEFRKTRWYLSDLYVKRGDLYLEQGQLALAEEAYRKALEYSPNVAATYGLLRVAARREDHERVLALAAEIERQQPGWRDVGTYRVEALRALGLAAFEAKRYGTATSYFTELLRWAPEDGPAHYYAGLLALEGGRHREAVEHLTFVRDHLGLDYQATRRLLLEALVGDARRRIQEEDWYNALDVIAAALKLDPNRPDLYIMRGQVMERLRRWERAAEAYRRAMKLPVQAPPEAREALERLLETHPELRDTGEEPGR